MVANVSPIGRRSFLSVILGRTPSHEVSSPVAAGSLENLSELLGALFEIAGEKKNRLALAHSFHHSVRIGLLAGAGEHGSCGEFHQVGAIFLDHGDQGVLQAIGIRGHATTLTAIRRVLLQSRHNSGLLTLRTLPVYWRSVSSTTGKSACWKTPLLKALRLANK